MEIIKSLKHPNLVEFRHAFPDGSLALEVADESLGDQIDAFCEEMEVVESVVFEVSDMIKMIRGIWSNFSLSYKL